MFAALKTVVYVIAPQMLTLRDVKTGKYIAEAPEIAIVLKPAPRIVGVGTAAKGAAATHGAELFNRSRTRVHSYPTSRWQSNCSSTS